MLTGKPSKGRGWMAERKEHSPNLSGLGSHTSPTPQVISGRQEAGLSHLPPHPRSATWLFLVPFFHLLHMEGGYNDSTQDSMRKGRSRPHGSKAKM